MTTGHEDYLGDLWDLLPVDPTDFLEGDPTEDEAEKAPTSEWAFDHNADINRHHTKFTIAEHDLAARHGLAVLDPLVCSEAEAADLVSLGVNAHQLIFNHGNYDTAFDWGDHDGLYVEIGDIYTDAKARSAIGDIFGADGKADANVDLDNHALLNVTNMPTKTKAAWTKTVGPTGDYGTFAEVMAAMPDLIAHLVTIIIQTGTILTETCFIRNKHALLNGAFIKIRAERYYPTAGALPTADGAGINYLEDVSAFTIDDYYNDCWIMIVDGTGTDNGYVKITDTDQATGRIIVDAWPGTQPDNTSVYLIVGALIDGETARAYGFLSENCTSMIYLYGIGFTECQTYNVYLKNNIYCELLYCGIYDCQYSGIMVETCLGIILYYCGIVANNRSNNASHGGVHVAGCNAMTLKSCGISDNNQRGVLVRKGGFVTVNGCFGDLNGLWGTYAQRSGQVFCPGVECSGTSGDHSHVVGEGALAY